MMCDTKIMSMHTDPNHLRYLTPDTWKGTPYSLIWMLSARQEHFERYLPDYADPDELKAHYTRGGLGDVKVKKFLNNVMQETFGTDP